MGNLRNVIERHFESNEFKLCCDMDSAEMHTLSRDYFNALSDEARHEFVIESDFFEEFSKSLMKNVGDIFTSSLLISKLRDSTLGGLYELISFDVSEYLTETHSDDPQLLDNIFGSKGS